MSTNKEKLSKIFQIGWLVIAFPLASFLSHALSNRDILMQMFCYILVSSPAWIIHSWNWYKGSNEEQLPKKLLISVFALSLGFTFALGEMYKNYKYELVVLLPLLCFVVLFFFNMKSYKVASTKIFSFLVKICEKLKTNKKRIFKLIAILLVLCICALFCQKRKEEERAQIAINRYVEKIKKEEAEVFNFPPYDQKQKDSSLSISAFLESVKDLTKFQEQQKEEDLLQYLDEGYSNQDSNSSIIYDHGVIEDVVGAGVYHLPLDGSGKYLYPDYPYVTIICGEKQNTYESLNYLYPRTRMIFNLKNEEALKLKKGTKVKFIGRLRHYDKFSNKMVLKQVAIENE